MKRKELYKYIREEIITSLSEDATAMVTSKAGTKSVTYKNPSELDALKKDSNVSSITTTSGQKLKEEELEEMARNAVKITIDNSEKAEIALTKALEIDSAYSNAQYHLGTHFYDRADEMYNEAKELPENDASYEPLMEKATAMQYRSLALLEKYIAVNPLDKTVLEILRSTYSKLGNNEKASEYKNRIEALKN